MKLSVAFLLIVSSVVLMGPALAQDSAPASPNSTPSQASPSRSEVKAQTRAAEQAGQIPRGESEMAKPDTTRSVKARSDVKKEARTAEAAIKQPRTEFGAGSHDPNRSTANRAQVKAETRQAEHAGEIPRGEAQPQ